MSVPYTQRFVCEWQKFTLGGCKGSNQTVDSLFGLWGIIKAQQYMHVWPKIKYGLCCLWSPVMGISVFIFKITPLLKEYQYNIDYGLILVEFYLIIFILQIMQILLKAEGWCLELCTVLMHKQIQVVFSPKLDSYSSRIRHSSKLFFSLLAFVMS